VEHEFFFILSEMTLRTVASTCIHILVVDAPSSNINKPKNFSTASGQEFSTRLQTERFAFVKTLAYQQPS